MKIYSKFAVLIAFCGLLLIGVAFWQWQTIIPQWQPTIGRYPDASQFFLSSIIAVGAILYARETWNKARENNIKEAWQEEHTEYHKKIVEELKKIQTEHQEVRELANEMTLKLAEANLQ